MPRMYQPPDYYRPSGTGRIVDLMLRRGDIQAEGAARSGQIWGGAVRGLGDIATTALQERAEQRAKQQEADEQQRRDEAFMGLIQRSGGAPELGEVIGILGRDAGMKAFEGLSAFQSIGQKRGEQAMAEIPKLARGLRAVSEPLRAQMYPAIAERIKATGLFPPDAIPDEYDPARVDEMLSFAESLGDPKEEEAFTLGPDQVRFQGGKEIARGVTKPVDPPQPRVVGRALVGPDGKVIYRDPETGGSGQQGEQGSPDSEVSFLLGGGTADKLPINIRAAAVAEAKKSGGIDGTGFVPMNNQQQTKYQDFQDLRSKIIRLEQLLAMPEVSSKLGPAMGRLVGATKEWTGVGQNAIVKEAFDLMKDLSDAELRKRSGAAISPGEYVRIIGFTVDPVKQPDSNLTNLTRMKAAVSNALRGIGVSKFADEAEPLEIGTTVTSPKRTPRQVNGVWER